MSDENDPLLGRVIDGRFTIQSVLGRGGMGVVYRAHQGSLERSVALKLMSGVPPDRESEFQRRFFLEAATAAKLKHPNTITVFDYGSSDIDGGKVFFIAMELVEGITLAKLMSKGQALPLLRAVGIAMQIGRSLREAHKAGVVHRDLKPGNVMIGRPDGDDDDDVAEGDFVKVLDFGLAKTHTFDGAKPIEGLTKSGTFMGSPRYVAPEQIEGKLVDARADIYSLGCILYRMICGHVPYDGSTPVEIMLKHLHDPVPALDAPVAVMPKSLEMLVLDCLAKDPKQRPPTMDSVLQRLKLARAELGGTGSGIMMVSGDNDSRISIPEQEPVDQFPSLPSLPSLPSMPSLPPAEDPLPEPEPAPLVMPRVQARVALPRPTTSPGESTDSAWKKPMTTEDSTRPTRVLGQISLKRPPKRPWAAIAAGMVVGLTLCAAFALWRFGVVDVRAAADRAVDKTRLYFFPLPVTLPADELAVEDAPLEGPFAKQARVRIKTTPAGADVLEVQGGLPRLLGTTPLTLTWDIGTAPKKRSLTLRKEGFKPAQATLVPPKPGPREPVWLDVEAALRPR